MKQRIAILFGVAVFLVLAVACDDGPRRYDPDAYACDAECEAQRLADMEYLAKNFPTREDALRIRECATAKTGYDEFPELARRLWASESDADGRDAGTQAQPDPRGYALQVGRKECWLPLDRETVEGEGKRCAE